MLRDCCQKETFCEGGPKWLFRYVRRMISIGFPFRLTINFYKPSEWVLACREGSQSQSEERDIYPNILLSSHLRLSPSSFLVMCQMKRLQIVVH